MNVSPKPSKPVVVVYLAAALPFLMALLMIPAAQSKKEVMSELGIELPWLTMMFLKISDHPALLLGSLFAAGGLFAIVAMKIRPPAARRLAWCGLVMTGLLTFAFHHSMTMPMKKLVEALSR